ncbi:MAG: hypothetical protein L0I24_01415 [Pseudonocardia sp.]|nr:hypothetical protein [Pseudonocardia sp.]
MRGRRAAGALLMLLLAAGCTSAVPGTGRANGPVAVTGSPAAPESTTAPPPGSQSALAADVLPDECLLDALGFSALLGEPVLPPEQVEVVRGDGSSTSSCFANSARGAPDPLAAVNVYEPRDGSPTDFVRSAAPQGRRELTGVGGAASLVDTASGVTLQLATARYLVTIAVLDGTPSDDAWRAAATAALDALGG